MVCDGLQWTEKSRKDGRIVGCQRRLERVRRESILVPLS